MRKVPIALLLLTYTTAPALALPPAEDTPEEVLRTRIITEARSPVTGEPLTAAEYVTLQEELAEYPPRVDTLPPQIRRNVFLLQLRRNIRIVFPFLLR